MYQNTTYLLQLGRKTSNFVEIGIEAISSQNYARTAGRTRLQVPVGKWTPVWGISGGDKGERESRQLGSSLRRGKSDRASESFSGLEIRVSPAGF